MKFKEFNQLYPDDDACLDKIFNDEYCDTSTCSHCNKAFKYYKVKDRKVYACQWCGHQIAPLAGTIFHKSRTSLLNWFYVFFLFAKSKNGVAAKEVERQIGVTYKCAWRMCKQIRSLMAENNILCNTIEVDETYVGGKEKNKHRNKKIKNAQGRSCKGKVPIIGAVERDGRLVAKVTKDTNEYTIQNFLLNNVARRTVVHSDALGYAHHRVNHGAREYVNGDNTTNRIESFWSQLKRSLHGTYHCVSPKYLQSYVNEFVFRYNLKKDYDDMFNILCSKATLCIK